MLNYPFLRNTNVTGAQWDVRGHGVHTFLTNQTGLMGKDSACLVACLVGNMTQGTAIQTSPWKRKRQNSLKCFPLVAGTDFNIIPELPPQDGSAQHWHVFPNKALNVFILCISENAGEASALNQSALDVDLLIFNDVKLSLTGVLPLKSIIQIRIQPVGWFWLPSSICMSRNSPSPQAYKPNSHGPAVNVDSFPQ